MSVEINHKDNYVRIGGSDALTESLYDQAFGVPQLDAEGFLSGIFIVRQETAANLASVVLQQGELAYATDTGKVSIGDGTTTFENLVNIGGGGFDLLTEKIFTSVANQSIVVEPNGNGAFQLSSTGDARGTNAVDLQIDRTNDTQVASGNNSAILGGRRNTATGANSVAFGFQTTASGFGSVAHGEGTTALGDYSTASGYGSTASGNYSTASGNYDNPRTTATATFATAIGSACTASGNFSYARGNDCDATKQYSYSFGGSNNATGDYSAVLSGQNNNVSSSRSVIAGGSANTISGSYNFIACGFFNNITTTGFGKSAIICGDSNSVSGNYSFIGGGSSNNVSGDYATVLCGQNNDALSSYSAVLSGQNNTAETSSYAVVLGGRDNTASGSYSTASGNRAKSSLYGQHAKASGRFSTNGDAQKSSLVLRRKTTDATATNLFLDGSTGEITIEDKDTKFFTIKVAARREDTADESAMFELKGGVDRYGDTSTIALVGNVSKEVISRDNASWDVDVTADATGLHITVTGEAGKTIRWVSAVDLVEVNG